jgi:dinuclear metal center YbgI/SA1388 family protein
MPARLQDIVSELDELLQPHHFKDYGPNGLQVPGRDEVTTVVSGVSAQLELFERAAAEKADLVLVHHGLFWGSMGPIDLTMKRRLALLFERDMSLLAYHLPLDAHPEVGNNALLAAAVGADESEPFGISRGAAIGRMAGFHGTGVLAGELLVRVGKATGREPLCFPAGPERVRRLAIVSGGGCDFLGDAIAAGADAFLTGEPTERVMAQAIEGGVHFLAAGHYATETFGVRSLGEHLAARFGVRHVFVDVPNPI